MTEWGGKPEHVFTASDKVLLWEELCTFWLIFDHEFSFTNSCNVHYSTNSGRCCVFSSPQSRSHQWRTRL